MFFVLLRGNKINAQVYSKRAATPKTAARPAPAPVAALTAPALKAGCEVEAAGGTPVAPAPLGTRGVEVTAGEEAGMETGVVGMGVEEELRLGVSFHLVLKGFSTLGAC